MTESVLPATRERSSAGAAGPGALRKLDRALDLASSGIASICAGLIAVFLLGMVLAASFQVLSRYLISSLVGEPEEIARMAMVGMVFLALPVLARYSDHIRLDLAQETIKSAVLRKWIVRLVLVAELLFLAVLTVLAWSFVEQLWVSPQKSPALGMRLFWTRLPVLVGCALAAFVTAAVLIRNLLGFVDSPREEVEVSG